MIAKACEDQGLLDAAACDDHLQPLRLRQVNAPPFFSSFLRAQHPSSFPARHCACVYYHDWHRSKRPKPALQGNILPGVSRSVSPQPPQQQPPSDLPSVYNSPRNTLASTTGVVVATNDPALRATTGAVPAPAPHPQSSTGLAFDEEAKLVYGVILSLRNMVKKLSGRDENFVNYRTSTYKLHLFETMTGYKFVMLTDPSADSARFALRQLYAGPFIEHVVRNPLVSMNSREHGIDNEQFRNATDRFIHSLPIFI
ncbi:hypothetical protein BOTBODRAFT_25623 [Botryobasidium botryosum FD-172 SS1]|uniref:Trafficking protein particle complex subunit n=1 Tax=Botryobasidium botryosum (strain FD-172 SS1) TaxID=930990 RepID=A0A067MZM0_BOTB1|nr:hypothetical protein BOTBODRAFT_25623 [Botryobasidium botryosum FD-172 SS1]